MIVKELVSVLGSTTIVSIRLHDDMETWTAKYWFNSCHQWLGREIVQVQVESHLYNTISVLLNHSEDEEAQHE